MGDLVLDGDYSAPLKPITDYPTPLGEYLGAEVGSTVQQIKDRWDYLEGSRPDNTVIGYTPEGQSIFGTDPSQTRVAPDSAQTQLDTAGVKMTAPADGMYQDTIDQLVQRQNDQTARQVAISASPAGMRSVLGFGAQALTSMLDPINLAASFVPVIGPMKYTALLAGAGGAAARFGIRAGVGAAEGAVGTALTQPLDYLAAKAQGDDYSMTNALENVAFGAAFGAGLHSIGGAVHDVIKGAPKVDPTITTDVPETLPTSPTNAPDISDIATRAGRAPITVKLETGEPVVSPLGAAWMNNSISHETRIAATSTAIAQLADGRNIDIEPLIRADPSFQYAMAQRQQPTDMAMAITQARADVEPQLRAELTATAGNEAARGDISQVRAQLDQVNAELARPAVPAKEDVRALQTGQKLKFSDAQARAQAELNTRRADLTAQAERLNQAIDTNRQANQAAQDLAALDRGEMPDRYQDQVQARAEQLMQGDPLHAAIRQLFDPAPDADRAAAQRFGAPDNVSVADADMARAADTHLTEIPQGLRDTTSDGAKAAMDEAEARLKDALPGLTGDATGKLEASIVDELKPYDDDVKDAAGLAKGILDAALCGLTR